MPKVIIKGVPGLDGEYEFDLTFTHRDFHTIKKLTDVRANEVQGALEAGDMDIIVAIAEIALQRAQVPHLVDQLWDAQTGQITLALDEAEADAVPPPPSDSDDSPSDEPSNDAEKPSSTTALRSVTELSPEMSPPNGSGTQPQESTSDPATSTI